MRLAVLPFSLLPLFAFPLGCASTDDAIATTTNSMIVESAGTVFPICGKVTANTTACLSLDRSRALIENGAVFATYWTTATDSVSFPGYTAYTGFADLNGILGFTTGGFTSVSLVVDDPGVDSTASFAELDAHLLYETVTGAWTDWPSSNGFSLVYDATPCCKH
jgi:hypothetical protein